MFSKNNLYELMRKQEAKKQRFTIKKLTVGVASVLIGFTFMGVSASASDNAPAPTSSQVTKPVDVNTLATSYKSDPVTPASQGGSAVAPAPTSSQVTKPVDVNTPATSYKSDPVTPASQGGS
ncbi:YSIRK-type signal peptide-containing protein, partial [Limosilactobacillus fastidiosus]